MFAGSAYALIAGFLGAAASLSAKLSFGPDYVRETCASALSATVCNWLHAPLRLLCAGLLFACNAVMWTFFSKALHHCSSSAVATVATSASSFICSGVLGRLMFGESHAALWWAGISLTLCGLLVLHGATPHTLPHVDSKKDK
ncbi:transmembrane protein 42-like [Xenentodon cancila]